MHTFHPALEKSFALYQLDRLSKSQLPVFGRMNSGQLLDRQNCSRIHTTLAVPRSLDDTDDTQDCWHVRLLFCDNSVNTHNVFRDFS